MGFVNRVLRRNRVEVVAESPRQVFAELTFPQRKAVARAIRSLMDDPSSVPVPARGPMVRERVLPLLYDWTGFIALSPSGRLDRRAYDGEDDLFAPVDLERIREAVLFQGAKLYPELPFLVPVRPPDATSCGACRGTGRLTLGARFEHLAETIVCECGGLGWLPPVRNGRPPR